MMTQIYIAGPLFNTHERSYLEEIAQSLEQLGFETFLPHRDAGLLIVTDSLSRQRIFDADIRALDSCDACVALLTGPDHDSGTAAELGYAHARGKPCFGITDDMRWMNNLIWGLCNYGKWIAQDIDGLVQLVGTNLKSD